MKKTITFLLAAALASIPFHTYAPENPKDPNIIDIPVKVVGGIVIGCVAVAVGVTVYIGIKKMTKKNLTRELIRTNASGEDDMTDVPLSLVDPVPGEGATNTMTVQHTASLTAPAWVEHYTFTFDENMNLAISRDGTNVATMAPNWIQASNDTFYVWFDCRAVLPEAQAKPQEFFRILSGQ